MTEKSLKFILPSIRRTRQLKLPEAWSAPAKKGIEIACLGGETLLITELQAAGKKRMKASDYLLGHPIKVD
ncbi:MAG: hypothetical protein V8T41_09250 [Oscillospiraceae bacterium]